MPDLIPHIQQYSGVWSIEPKAEARFRQMLKAIKWQSHFAEAQSRADEGEHRAANGYELTSEGVAIVDLEGVLTKYGSSLSSEGSTVRFRQTLRQVQRAHAAGQVRAAMLCIESPGGSTMGTPEAAAEVAKLASIMPVWTYFEDIGASAAYWIGSQASRVIANESALVGSIGTYFAIDDVSKAFTKAGIKTHLFTTGAHKGAGYIGTELSAEQQAEFQSLVEKMNAPFVAAVQSAREFDDDEIEAVADGRCWRGEEAVALGLIDAVMTYEDALAELSSTASTTPQPQQKGSAMPKPKASTISKTDPKSVAAKAKSEEQSKSEDMMDDDEEEVESEEDEKDAESAEDEKDEAESKSKAKAKVNSSAKPASIADLKAALPEASSDFILDAIESGLSVADARTAYLESTVKAQAEQIKKLEAQGPQPGAKPLIGKGGKSTAITDPISQWREAVKASGSIAKTVKDNPELHAAYIEALNSRRAS